MFKQKWDNENNGVLLSNKISEDQSIVSPRPVFFEELDLLGFGDHWNYPKCLEPLLWAIGRRYYYKGIFVAEVKGGNIYDKPILDIKQKLTIEPINVEKLIKKNIEALKVLESEAIDFIQDTHKRYKNKVDLFSVAFSGGKDSQVILDLISRVLAPDEYVTIFTDTTMEIPFTYEAVENTKKKYKQIYPNLQFYTIKPKESALEYWEKFGPPSR
ncbi:MAG: phosphoadenosine phosphosulfate reductase family protein, partial [Candidatus Lokiarchaeota archaeon]|nr:phosphoadenosine phosphosulfate reductase family protein [Candidatus Lokiarchaeota archaeon]